MFQGGRSDGNWMMRHGSSSVWVCPTSGSTVHRVSVVATACAFGGCGRQLGEDRSISLSSGKRPTYTGLLIPWPTMQDGIFSASPAFLLVNYFARDQHAFQACTKNLLVRNEQRRLCFSNGSSPWRS